MENILTNVPTPIEPTIGTIIGEIERQQSEMGQIVVEILKFIGKVPTNDNPERVTSNYPERLESIVEKNYTLLDLLYSILKRL